MFAELHTDHNCVTRLSLRSTPMAAHQQTAHMDTENAPHSAMSNTESLLLLRNVGSLSSAVLFTDTVGYFLEDAQYLLPWRRRRVDLRGKTNGWAIIIGCVNHEYETMLGVALRC